MRCGKTSIFIELIQATRTMRRIINKYCKKYGLNLMQLSIIFLSINNDMTVSSLAQTLDVSKSAISQFLIKLYIKKYVTKKNIDGNKKVFYLTILPRGKEVHQDLLQMINEKEFKINEQLGNEKLTTLKQLMNEYIQALKEGNEEERG